jgi:peptide/nickel transport system permease protein
MQNYIMKRLLAAIPTFFAVTIVIFVMVRVLPGDIVGLMLENQNSALTQPGAADDLREDLGLNDPIPVQYFDWLTGFLQGDLGESPWSGRPVFEEAMARMPTTLELAAVTMFVATFIGIVAGVAAAVMRNSLPDYALRVFSVTGLAAPGFWVATLLIVVLSNYFGYLPPPEYKRPWEEPWTNAQQMIWPALVLGIALSANILRMTRATMLDVLHQDYIRTAYAKGLRGRSIITQHALRNSLIPVVTIMGAQFGFLLGGTVIMERIFTLPGLGELLFGSINQRDYPQLQLAIVMLAMTYLLLNLAVDIIYGIVDPRIRERYRSAA